MRSIMAASSALGYFEQLLATHARHIGTHISPARGYQGAPQVPPGSNGEQLELTGAAGKNGKQPETRESTRKHGS